MTTGIDVNKFSKLIPDQTIEIKAKRLKFLKEEAKEIRIAVFGKYNHGKSTLLNAIIGKEIFKTADKRETIKNAEHKHNEIIWIDTPGLDADVNGKDDERAMEGAFKLADIILLIHSMQAGELDKYEMLLYQRLIKKDSNYQEKLFLILTQIDQLIDDQYTQVLNKIKSQMPDILVFPVSATRYLRGIEEKKESFINISGIPNVVNNLENIKNKIYDFRKREIEEITSDLFHAITKERTNTAFLLQQANENKNNQNKVFFASLSNYKETLNYIKSSKENGSFTPVFHEILEDLFNHFFDEDVLISEIENNSELQQRAALAKTEKDREKILNEMANIVLSGIKNTSLEENEKLREYFDKYEIPPAYFIHFKCMFNVNFFESLLKDSFNF